MLINKTISVFAIMLIALSSALCQVRNESETIFPEEGSIPEAYWGTYLLENEGALRNLRLGVSNDLYTRAEIQLENNNTSHGRIYFKTNQAHSPAVTRMTIQSNGNVGIGTTAPSTKLAVNGTIRAREIKVETANWPDYVFGDDYDLKPLSEVERYINENGHLPEIPKASEVEAEGVSLGEMNKLLLKKVEELTLHLIEKEKEVADMKNGMDKMEERIYRLENGN